MRATCTTANWRRRRWRALALVFALPALFHLPATTLKAADGVQSSGLPAPFWRSFFARPGTVPAPPDNPQSTEKTALGHALFHDTRLSGNGQRSCASCHQPARSFTDAMTRAEGIKGQPLRRNTPSLYNLAWGTQYYWDGRAPSLEAQARVPIEHKDEMGGSLPVIAAKLKTDAVLARHFERAFPAQRAITPDTITKALAAYVRSLVSKPTRFDRFIAGDETALSTKETAGFNLFIGKAGCVACHAGWRFTDNRFHNIGLPGNDPGRGAVAGGIKDWPAFKTPGLLGVAGTAPYMHDGSLAGLSAVIDHYAGGFERRRNLSSNMLRDLTLSPVEKAQLIAFLRSLSAAGANP